MRLKIAVTVVRSRPWRVLAGRRQATADMRAGENCNTAGASSTRRTSNFVHAGLCFLHGVRRQSGVAAVIGLSRIRQFPVARILQYPELYPLPHIGSALRFSKEVRQMDELFAICSTYEVDDGGARGFVLARPDETGASKPWPILVTRKPTISTASKMPARIRARGWTPSRANSSMRTAISSPAENIMPSSISTPATASSAPVRARP